MRVHEPDRPEFTIPPAYKPFPPASPFNTEHDEQWARGQKWLQKQMDEVTAAEQSEPAYSTEPVPRAPEHPEHRGLAPTGELWRRYLVDAPYSATGIGHFAAVPRPHDARMVRRVRFYHGSLSVQGPIGYAPGPIGYGFGHPPF